MIPVYVYGPLLYQNFWVILYANYDEEQQHIFRDLYHLLRDVE